MEVEYVGTTEERATKLYTVVFSLPVDAYDMLHAAQKAHNVLRSDLPISLSVFEGKNHRNAVKIIPYLEEHIINTVKNFDATASVDVEINHDTDEVIVTVVSDRFKEIPSEEARISYIHSMMSSLPDEDLERIFYSCFTEEEYENYEMDGAYEGPTEDEPEEDEEETDAEPTIMGIPPII